MGRNKIDKDCLYYLPNNNLGDRDWCSKADCKCKLGSSYCESDYKSNQKIETGGRKVGKQNDKVIEGEIITDDTKLNNIKKATTLDGKNLCQTSVGQNRDLDVSVMPSVDGELEGEWLPKLLNLEGAGEKYKNIGENELKFILCLLKYGNNNNSLAYKEVYATEGLSKDYIEQRAYDLKRRPDVADLLGLLRERLVRQTEKQLQWQFRDSVNSLKYLIDTAMEEIQIARDNGKQSFLTLTRVTAIKDAVKELNQMMGYTDKSVKINQSVTIIGKEEDLPD